ncbi:MAG: diguanylate cyclase [Clostridiaceae bacterium]|nr:diguanylate cyclase [Clostridiaceae bacterium]
MFKNDEGNEIQINQILNIIKIASLSFPAIAFLQYFSVNHSDMEFFLRSGFLLSSVLLIILIIYVLWIFLQSKISDRFPFKKWIDPAISLSTAFLSVMLTGAYQSNYKFLFLLVIISSSIECSMKESTSIATLSAVTVLGIDLVCAPEAAVNTFFESDIVLACVFMIISWTTGYYVNLRKKHIESLKDLANIDGLTGLYNHRYFYDILSQQLYKSKNDGNELSLLFIDIDDFKIYNDLYGHQKGDEVLHIIAGIMKDTVPSNSFVARYGGEEFAILFPNTGEVIAMKEAEKLRKTIQEHLFEGQEHLPGGNLTISVGVSTFPTKAKTDADLLKYADQACYRAKFLYKNRVEAYYSILEELQSDLYEIDNETVVSIKTLIAVINAKDKYTYGHVERVVFYCTLLAEKLGLNETDKKILIYSAYLHDIGKINISGDILIKAEPLTDEEWEILKNHPQKAVEIIQNINSLKDMIPIILHHHERYDGTGYPCHLKGEEIHYLARILAVVDSFDAMTSIRPYQTKKSFNQAMKELIRCSGTQFDPEIVRVFISAIQDKTQAM